MNMHRRILWAGIALVALTNAVALGGAAWNRSGDGQGTLRLSQRELAPAVAWQGRSENSGLSLRLQWRSLRAPEALRHALVAYDGGDGQPAWLDAAKLRELGFDVDSDAGRRDAGDWLRRQHAREAFVVLELNGPAYREALRRAEASAQAASGTGMRHDADPGRLEWNRETGSRLFAVDAGLDRAALRVRYPDRTMYAIVHGRIGVMPVRPDTAPEGRIEALDNGEIDVPLEHRAVFEGIRPAYFARRDGLTRFEATVRFGRRSEPWLVDARRLPAAAAASSADKGR